MERKERFLVQCILIGIYTIVAGCSGSPSSDSRIVVDESPILGSWTLTRYLATEDSTEVWKKYPENILFQKHITPTHFMWFKYDKEADQLLGTGGGTYTYENGKYTEHIDFFYPPGANELGQSIPFSVTWENGEWHHLGYAKRMLMDEDTGTPVRQDSSKIDEMWIKINPAQKTTSTASVTGSWRLESYREASSSISMEYPAFVKYLKHITPTHFIWVKYNGEGDEVFEAAAGPYSLTNERYIENIEMMYPKGSGTIGKKIDFTYSMENDKWNHMGYVNRININLPDKPNVDLLIDEVWRKVK